MSKTKDAAIKHRNEIKDLFKSNPRLYRALLACGIGKDALDGKSDMPKDSIVEYALYNLLSTLEDVILEIACRHGKQQ